MQIRVENGFLLRPFAGILLAHPDNRAQGLYVIAIAFGLRVNIGAVVLPILDFGLDIFDALDNRLELVAVDCVVPDLTHSLSPFFHRWTTDPSIFFFQRDVLAPGNLDGLRMPLSRSLMRFVLAMAGMSCLPVFAL